MSTKPSKSSRIGYSYLRYSSPAQADGDSIRRQTAAARAWCDRHEVQLDTETTFEDRGRSAFRGSHRRASALSHFLAEVEADDIPRGSVLILENLDRLSRENPWDAVPLLCSIVNAGITVVTLSPSEVTYERGRDLTPLVLAVVEFGRGHSESASKSDRLTAVWGEKKRQARESGKIVTRRLPAWVEERGGKLVPVAGRAALVRRMFAMASAGCGLSVIVRKLTDEKVEPWGRGGNWSKAYVHKILSGRAALGEYQPVTAGKPDGPPIADYYPRVVDETTWDQVQAAFARRKEGPGRLGEKVANLFTGLVTDARGGGRMLVAWQTRGSGKNKQRARVLVSAASAEGREPSVSFPYPIFEEAVLSMLREVKVSDVIGSEPESETATLAAEIKHAEKQMADVEAQMVAPDGDIPALGRVLKALDARRQDLLKRHTIARRQDANPLAESWRSAKTLLDAAHDEPGRLKLRDLAKTIIESVWSLVVAGKSQRLAAVQLDFRGGGRRTYLIHYQPARRGRNGNWSARSFADAGLAAGIDLRKPADMKRVEKFLNDAPAVEKFLALAEEQKRKR